MASRVAAVAKHPAFNLALLVLTAGTTFTAYHQRFDEKGPYSHAALFSLSLILILGAHEMGHYILARLHRVEVTLPYFIPLPGFGVGTLGAIIRIRSRIPHRNALVDIGAAGPLAGLFFAIPIFAIGLANARLTDAPPEMTAFPGATSLWVLLSELFRYLGATFFGLPAAEVAVPSRGFAMVFGDSLLTIALRWLVLGPLPAGKDVLINPAILAGWFGFLVTMLNLMPMGQLDGGHVGFALFGKSARAIGKWSAVGMLFLCLFASSGWLVWLLITTKIIGFGHPEVADPLPPLTGSRKAVSWACFIALILCVMPAPVGIISIP